MDLIQYWIVQYKRENGRDNKIRFKTWYDKRTKSKTYQIINDLDKSTINVTKEDGNEIYKDVIKDYKLGKVKILKIV